MKKLFFLTIIFSAVIFAQSKTSFFEFDYAQFGYDSTSNYVEFYYSFNQDLMNVVSSDTAKSVGGSLGVIIINQATGEEVINREWGISHTLSENNETNRNLVGVISFILPEGKFNVEITGYDGAEKKNFNSIKELISVDPFLDSDELAISDVQLASRIIPESNNDNSIFYKNSYEVIPHPTAVFSESHPVLFFYSEFYNIMNSEGETLNLLQLVFNSRGDTIINKKKVISRNTPSRVEVGAVQLSNLPSDSYTIILSLIDSINNYGIYSTKKFFVYNPSVEPLATVHSGATEMITSQFNVMSEEEIDDLFDKGKYIATSNEIEQYNKLKDLKAKREFLFNFWKNREGAQGIRNASLNEYIKRLEQANVYGNMFKKGWRTDRGRVLLMYGEPSEIERFPNQLDAKPYEIWHYNNIEGGVVFVFADLTGFSDYLLIHSTVRGELRDDTWQRRIRTL
jgi:GWxTD domain-containing protein